MAVGAYLRHAVAVRELLKAACLHDGGVGLVEQAAFLWLGIAGRCCLFLRVVAEELVVVHTRHGGALAAVLRRDEQQQFFAFVAGGYYVHLAHHRAVQPFVQVAHGFVPVEHGREFDEGVPGLVQPSVAVGQQVGGAVGYAEGAPSLQVSPCGVGVEQGLGWERVEQLHAVAFLNGDGDEAQHTEVVAGSGAEHRLPFYIGAAVEPTGHEGEVYPVAAGQVGEQGGLWAVVGYPPANLRLVEGGHLRRALLHGEWGRVEQPLAGGPGGQFAACFLPALYLLQRQGQVHIGGCGIFQGQAVDVFLAVLADELQSGLVEGHGLMFRGGMNTVPPCCPWPVRDRSGRVALSVIAWWYCQNFTFGAFWALASASNLAMSSKLKSPAMRLVGKTRRRLL